MHLLPRLTLRTLFLGLLAAPLLSAPIQMAYADEAAQASDVVAVETPEAFIVGLVDDLRVLAAEDQADADRRDRLRDVLSEDMAIRRLQAYLLSTSQREELSEAQIKAYNEVFPHYISSAFAGSIDQLVSRTIKVDDVLERRPGDFIVRSKLYSESGQERASLDWRVLESKGKKKLADVIVDGLSFSVERRAQFTAIINKDGFEALIAHMEEIAELPSE